MSIILMKLKPQILFITSDKRYNGTTEVHGIHILIHNNFRDINIIKHLCSILFRQRLHKCSNLCSIIIEAFFERFNLHILECDCEVQQDTRLTTLAELTDWLRTMTLHGGGGTDFRPAFRYVDGLVERGEFAHLPGLLYFTDGYGVFPDVPPAYRAVFVMLRYRYDDIDLPPWAEKLVLEADKPKGDEAWI